MLSRDDRISGCLLGGALGDAIGAHFEDPSAGGGSAIPTRLLVTDDTQLTLATCEAIVESHAIEPEAIARRFVGWFRDRRISGIGASTLKALTELEAGGHWAVVGATGERAAGNGAAMRIAPLAFFLDPKIDLHRQKLRDICRITHRNEEAYVGGLAILLAIRHAALDGALDADFLACLIDFLPDSNVRDRLVICRDSSLAVEQYAERFAASGYVADSVPLAILAAIRGANFMHSVQQLASLGGDADTIASMFGQIFGAAYGVDSLPAKLLEAIDLAALVRETATNLARVSLTT